MRNHSITRLKSWSFLFVLFLLLLLQYKADVLSIGGDTLSAGESLRGDQTIVSKNGIFEMGFFPSVSSNSFLTYLGIWYKTTGNREDIVWVANRDNPLSGSVDSILRVKEDGNIELTAKYHNSAQDWSTNFNFETPNSTEAVLLDSGNFVLRDRLNPSTIFVQSFDYPTDTWLPGMKIGINKQLKSWKNSENPASGMYLFGLDPNGSNQLILEWNNSRRYWSSGFSNGRVHSFPIGPWINLNFSSNENESYFTYSLDKIALADLVRYVIDPSGMINQLFYFEFDKKWKTSDFRPSSKKDVYAFCGAFGVIDQYDSCGCLPGFKHKITEATKLNDWSSGCVRTTPLWCENAYGATESDQFQNMLNVKFSSDSQAHPGVSAGRCKSICIRNCSCTAYAYNSSGCFIWEGDLLNVQLVSYTDIPGRDFYLRLAAFDSFSTEDSGNKTKLWVIITAVVVFTALLISGCVIKLIQMGILGKNSSKDLLVHDFNTNYNATDYESNATNNLSNGRKKDFELPVFSFKSVSASTANFSAANKLGEGGFGPVFKGTLPKGQEVAVKRLSKRSGQGLQEFKNEATLIAKLQHRNLVRLLGCCIKRDEYILIYEYMANKSLDFFLFDQSKQEMLDCATRIRIIEGITQGLLYLHQYSRLRIIHRDMKPSNILLDSEMNPKISDFGMARIFGGNDTETNTDRIVGTYGYMSPEYAMKGIFSVKSDVFSFGVILLEIVSGRKNIDFYHSESLNLLTYAWELWNSDRALELIDPIIGHPSSTSTLLKYINIGLLCVEEAPTDRPTISDVVSMINNDNACLPTPRQPAFTIGSRSRNVVDRNASGINVGICSLNKLSITSLEAR